MAIYNAYLEGAEREAAIFNMEMDNQYEKLSMLYEMTLMELAQAKKDIELKVFRESGTYDDLEYLLSEAEAQAAEGQQNIISQILNWFANAIQKLFTNIKNFFTGAKNIPDDADVQVDMYDNEDGMFKTVTSILDNVANMDGKITIENVLKVALGSIAGGGAILAIADKINKDHPIKTRIVKFAVAKKWDQTAQALGGKIQSITGAITSKFGDNAVIQTILDKVCKPIMDVLNTISDKCSAALQVVKSKFTGGDANAAAPQNGPAPANAPTGPASVTSATPDKGNTRVKVVYNDSTSGTAVQKTAYVNTAGKVIGGKDKDGNVIPAAVKKGIESSPVVKDGLAKIANAIQNKAMQNSPQAQLATGNQVETQNQKNAKEAAAKQKAEQDKAKAQQKAAKAAENHPNNQFVQNSANDLQIELGDDYTVEVADDGVLEVTINKVIECPEDYLSTTQSIFGMVAEEEASEDPELLELQKLFEEL